MQEGVDSILTASPSEVRFNHKSRWHFNLETTHWSFTRGHIYLKNKIQCLIYHEKCHFDRQFCLPIIVLEHLSVSMIQLVFLNLVLNCDESLYSFELPKKANCLLAFTFNFHLLWLDHVGFRELQVSLIADVF